MEEHVQHVRAVLRRLRDAGFTLNSTKMTIAAKEVAYIGHCLSSRGISVLPDRVAAIKAFPRPTNLRTLRSFIGILLILLLRKSVWLCCLAARNAEETLNIESSSSTAIIRIYVGYSRE